MGAARGRGRAPGTLGAGRWGGWGWGRGARAGRRPRGGGEEGVRAAPRPCPCRYCSPKWPQGPPGLGAWGCPGGGCLFPSSCLRVRAPSSVLPSAAADPLPEGPSLRSVSGPPFRLGVCPPPAGFLPSGSGRPYRPAASRALPPSFPPVCFSVSGPLILFVFGLPSFFCLLTPPPPTLILSEFPTFLCLSLERRGRSLLFSKLPPSHPSTSPFSTPALLSLSLVTASHNPHHSPLS